MKKLRKIFCLIIIVVLVLSFASAGYAKQSDDDKDFKLPKGIWLKIKNAELWGEEEKEELVEDEDVDEDEDVEEDEEIDEDEIEEERIEEDENIEEEDEDIIEEVAEEDEDVNDADVNKEKVMNKIQEKLMEKLIKIQNKANKFQERIQEQIQITNEIQERLQERLQIQQDIFEAIDSIINENIEKEDAEELIDTLEDYVKENPKAKKAYKELGKLYRKMGEKGLKVFVNGRVPKFDVPPVIKAGRTLIPVRAITEGLGAEVSFNPETRQVTVTKGDTEVVLTLGETVALVNGEPVEMDTKPGVISNRTFVPLRFLNEIFGAKVEYDSETHMVIIDEDSEDQEEEETVEQGTEETTEETTEQTTEQTTENSQTITE